MNQYVTGAVIKRLREEKNMTQQQLADKLSVSAKKISKWETAKGYPDITLLESIANALSVSVTELIYGNTIVNSNVSANNAAFTFLCVYGVWKYRSQHGRNSNSVSYSMFIRVNGKPQLCMLVSIAGCILNVVLDYMFVARMELGVKGSAIGSLLVQLVTVLAQLMFFFLPDTIVRFRRFVFDREVGKEMILNGSSEFIGEMASAISMFAFNYVLMKYVGADGVAAFTILGFVVYGYSMVCIGFGQGISPIVSICWGAKEKETATKIRSITNRILLAIGTLTALSFFIAGKRYAEIFGCSNSIADMVATGFRIYAITFLAMGYDVTGSMYFTSCGDAKSSAIISSLRGIVLLLAFILIFPAIFGMNGVWMASPCAEILTAIVTFVLIRRQVRKNKEEENGR